LRHNRLLLKRADARPHPLLLELAETRGHAWQHFKAHKEIEIVPPHDQIPVGGQRLDHVRRAGVEAGVEYGVVLGHGEHGPGLYRQVPQRDLRDSEANSADRIVIGMPDFGTDQPLPREFCEIELRSVEGDGARQSGEMPVDGPKLRQPLRTAVEVDDVNVHFISA